MIIRLHDAAFVIESLNEALCRLNKPEDRALHMIRSVQRVLARDAACEMILAEPSGDGREVRRLLRRFTLDSVTNGQQLLKEPVLNTKQAHDLLIDMLSRPEVAGRVPTTMVMSQDIGKAQSLMLELAEHQPYCDAMFSAWSSGRGCLAALGVFRRSEEPAFTAQERALLALNVRALAPVVDGSLFRGQQILREYDLTPRQREVLMLMLDGASEKEMAEQMHRSLHTVHTYVKQLYTLFNVSSRGELMSRFVERGVLFEQEGSSAEHHN